VTVTSISAYTASINRGDYCISKAGLAMMTQLYAAAWPTMGSTSTKSVQVSSRPT